MSDTENAVWNAFKAVCTKLLGKYKAENCREFFSEILKYFKTVKWNMSLKPHFLDSHLEFSPQNLGNISDEHGDRFRRDIAIMEKRFVGRWFHCW